MLNLSSVLQSLTPERGATERTTCPVCGMKDRLTITNRGADVVYNCYSMNCGISGRFFRTLDYAELINMNESIQDDTPKLFIPPAYFTSIRDNARAREYLESVNSYEAYLDGKVLIRHDPKQDRVVFYDKFTAVGRGKNPKWHQYTKNGLPFIVNHVKSSTLVLVEDVPSAINVSKVHNGCALLGTTLYQTYLPLILKYRRVIICLDADATRKAISMHHELSPYMKAIIKPLDKDLKYFTKDELKDFFNE